MARTKRRSTTTPAQREAARQRDAELAAKAAQALADPNLSQKITALLATGTPRLLGYSLRNQALLMKQAEERGMTLADVDTFRGWRDRGRGVRRGEHGLRIVRPVGLEVDEDTDDAEHNQQQQQKKQQQQDDEPVVRFRSMVVFDVSQTDGADDVADAIQQQETDADPHTILFASLRGQAERAGYLVTEQPDDESHAAPVEADHEARTINVYEGGAETLAHLAAVIAAVLSEQADQKQQRKQRPTVDDVPTITVA